MALPVSRYWEQWMHFTKQVYAFVWELFVLPLCKVSTSKREKPRSPRRLRFAMNYVLKLHSVPENPAYDSVVNPKFLSTLRLSLISPQPLEFVFNLTFWQLGLMLRAFPMTVCLLMYLLGLSLYLLWDRSHLVKKISELIQNSINNFFLSYFLLFPTTVRFLLKF